jgi:uncharacterized protein YkwD
MRTIQTNLLSIFMCSLFAFMGQAVAKSSLNPQQAEILILTNKEREKAGLKPLTINSNLMEVAQAQSASMAQVSDLSHTLNGKDLSLRIEKINYPYSYIGENIAQSPFPIPNVMTMWMTSEGHRRNILDPNYKELGIGIAVAPGGQTYYTQVFGARSNH